MKSTFKVLFYLKKGSEKKNGEVMITLDLHPSITDKIEKINLYSKERMQEVNHE